MRMLRMTRTMLPKATAMKKSKGCYVSFDLLDDK